MGPLILPEDRRVHVDANILIYRVEGIEPYSAASAPLWEALHRGECEVVTSELTLLEVMVVPIRNRDEALSKLYRDLLLDTEGFSCLPIDREILGLAAEVRAKYRLRTRSTPRRPFIPAPRCSSRMTRNSGRSTG